MTDQKPAGPVGEVALTINGRKYGVSCDQGQERRLQHLGRFLDSQIQKLVEEVGQIGDTRLMLMAGLVIADELADARDKVKNLERQVGRLQVDIEGRNKTLEKTQTTAANAVDLATQRIEAMTNKIEGLAASA